MEEPYDMNGVLVPPQLAVSVSGSVTASPTSSADGDTSWTNEGNLYTDDATNAVLALDAATTNGLDLYDFDFGDLPENAIITGITVEYEAKKDEAAGEADEGLMKFWVTHNAATETPASGVYAPLLDTALRVDSVGGADYLWGRAWTVAEVQDGTNFRVIVRPRPGTIVDTPTVVMDYVKCTVYYERAIEALV